jgi:hypothetical protein
LSLWDLFRRKNYLDVADEDWLLQTWSWMLKHYGGVDRLKKSPLVVPTDSFFPPVEFDGEKWAEYIFGLVKKYAGLAELQCKLSTELPQRNEVIGELRGQKLQRSTRGDFHTENGQVVIRYDLALTQNPFALVQVFAHELAHYWVQRAVELPPGGNDLMECATDLTTVFLGFGIFGCDNALNFQSRIAWSNLGYLEEDDWAYALAIFLNLRGEGPHVVKRWLKSYLYSSVKSAGRVLSANPEKLVRMTRAQSIPQQTTPVISAHWTDQW